MPKMIKAGQCGLKIHHRCTEELTGLKAWGMVGWFSLQYFAILNFAFVLDSYNLIPKFASDPRPGLKIIFNSSTWHLKKFILQSLVTPSTHIPIRCILISIHRRWRGRTSFPLTTGRYYQTLCCNTVLSENLPDPRISKQEDSLQP